MNRSVGWQKPKKRETRWGRGENKVPKKKKKQTNKQRSGGEKNWEGGEEKIKFPKKKKNRDQGKKKLGRGRGENKVPEKN